MSEIKMEEVSLELVVDFGEAEGVQAGYKEGYKDGEAEGYSKGEAKGEAEGQAKGYQEGHTAGYIEGYGKGEAAGHTAGYTEGYDKGEAQGELVMWDNITNFNTEDNYESKFGDWGGEYIRPPYQIKPIAKRSFYCTFNSAKRLKKVEASYFDFSQKERGTANTQEGYFFTFYNCLDLEEIEDVGIQPDYAHCTTFANCVILKKIACIRVDANTQFDGAVFNYCYALEEVRFEGVIGRNGINLRWSTNLSKASWVNIMTKLSPSTTGLSITGSLASVKKAFETLEGANDGNTSDEWLALIATKPNWTISLA